MKEFKVGQFVQNKLGLCMGKIADISERDDVAYPIAVRAANGCRNSYTLEGYLLEGMPISDNNLKEEIEFVSQHAIWSALLEGVILGIKNEMGDSYVGMVNGMVCQLDKYGKLYHGYPCQAYASFADFSEWEEYNPIVPRWEDKISIEAPILCHVFDEPDDTPSLRNVQTYYSDDAYNYRYEDTQGDHWVFATPLTLEGMTQYILECRD